MLRFGTYQRQTPIRPACAQNAAIALSCREVHPDWHARKAVRLAGIATVASNAQLSAERTTGLGRRFIFKFGVV